MDTEALRAFVAVSDGLSFSRAAERLHLTQPAISKRISNLEQLLNCRLFDRINRSVSLTPEGHTLLPRAKRILQEVEDTRRSLSDLSGDVGGELKLGISHHIGLHRLPPVLRAYSRQYPGVKLGIQFMDSEQAHQSILHGELDIAVITLAPTDEPQLVSRKIWHDPMSIAVAPDHPLAGTGTVSLHTLSTYTAIPPGLNTYTGRIVKRLFDAAGLKLDVALATNYMETIKMMVSIGLGWSVLPNTLIDSSVVALSLEHQTLERELGAVVHRNRSQGNAASAFIQALEANAAAR